MFQGDSWWNIDYHVSSRESSEGTESDERDEEEEEEEEEVEGTASKPFINT